MKFHGAFIFSVLFSMSVFAQKYEGVEQKSKDGRFTYKTVTNDPLKTRIYTLKNGLTVMMSPNKREPRLQTMIATRAGSKNDPADNTGLAHYLEHLLFKGTDKVGTKDFAKEKIELDKIEALYTQYNQTSDSLSRERVYRQIDSISGVAAQYAIASEYDAMISAMGAKGLNAFTGSEQTVYINDLPQNEMEKWLKTEGERFRNPILRLFHTELEVVYEEKNRGLDNDGRKVNEALFRGLYRNHPYGTQTTIGTIEHLKNPSITKIKKYYDTYYVPNNMAIILAGDFDMDQTITLIDQYFAYMQTKEIPPFTFKPEEERNQPTEITVLGPEAENVTIGFRLPGAGSKEALILEIADGLLSYNNAGLIDLNLVKQQKILNGYSTYWSQKDYTTHWLYGQPRQGQTLDEVKKMLMDQMDLLKKGEFGEEMMKAVVANLKADKIRQYETNSGRAFDMLAAFDTGQNWPDFAQHLDRMSEITKKDVVTYMNQYYKNDYVVVSKKIGEDKNVKKVIKPKITPLTADKESSSDFKKQILGMAETPIKPVFIDYKKDVVTSSLNKNVPIYLYPNTDNELFDLSYHFDMGSNHNKKLPYAIDYLQYLGTDTYSAQQISREFFKLACSFNVSNGEDQTYVTLSGLGENFDKALELFEHLLANAKPDQEALNKMIEGELKSRADSKLDRQSIFWNAMWNYSVYGKKNPFADQLSESELRALKADDLVQWIRDLTSYPHRVFYYGSKSTEEVGSSLSKYHKLPAVFKTFPAKIKYERQELKDNIVYFVNYDMVQAELRWTAKMETYDQKLAPSVALFNQYFGGSFPSVVFKDIRETKALAYSAFATYARPVRKGDPYYFSFYIGTQADKIHEAMSAMKDMLKALPKDDQIFGAGVDALKRKIETERIVKQQVLFNFDDAVKMGLDHDIRQDVYEDIQKMTFSDIQQFFNSRIPNKPGVLCVIASKNKITLDELNRYGKVIELSLQDIFGY